MRTDRWKYIRNLHPEFAFTTHIDLPVDLGQRAYFSTWENAGKTNEAAAKKFIHLMTAYNDAAHKVGSGFHMNPSPGNIKDGLITDAIKSLGAVRKGGNSPVVDVLDYTEPVTKPGPTSHRVMILRERRG